MVNLKRVWLFLSVYQTTISKDRYYINKIYYFLQRIIIPDLNKKKLYGFDLCIEGRGSDYKWSEIISIRRSCDGKRKLMLLFQPFRIAVWETSMSDVYSHIPYK